MRQFDSDGNGHPPKVRLVCIAVVAVLVLGPGAPRTAAAQSKGKFLKDVVVAAVSILAAKKAAKTLAEYEQRKAADDLESDEDPFRDCFVSLMAQPAAQDQKTTLEKLLANLQYQRRLAKEEAEDVAYSSLVDVCENHARRPYNNLANAFFQAGINRANKYWARYRRRYVSCENIATLADSCQSPNDWGARPDANTRFARELDVARRAWCSLEQQEVSIIIDHAVGKPFADIAQKNGLTARQAHDLYHNAIRRVRAQVANACPSD